MPPVYAVTITDDLGISSRVEGVSAERMEKIQDVLLGSFYPLPYSSDYVSPTATNGNVSDINPITLQMLQAAFAQLTYPNVVPPLKDGSVVYMYGEPIGLVSKGGIVRSSSGDAIPLSEIYKMSGLAASSFSVNGTAQWTPEGKKWAEELCAEFGPSCPSEDELRAVEFDPFEARIV